MAFCTLALQHRLLYVATEKVKENKVANVKLNLSSVHTFNVLDTHISKPGFDAVRKRAFLPKL
eukprot:6490277-Amphidinium_carterae.1